MAKRWIGVVLQTVELSDDQHDILLQLRDQSAIVVPRGAAKGMFHIALSRLCEARLVTAQRVSPDSLD